MTASSRKELAWSSASVGVIAALALLNIYRACTQSITIDEAYSYLSFVQPPIERILTTYDANHHILHSLLCKVSIFLLGTSAFTLRLPSLIGGILFSLFLWRILALVFPSRLKVLACLMLVALNPLILDFQSAARGYSLALAGLFAGLYFQLLLWDSYEKNNELSSLLRIGIAFGLSVSANLAFLFPCLASMIVYALMTAVSGRTAASFYRSVLIALSSFVLVCALLIYRPLSYSNGQEFVVGASSLAETLNSLLVYSLQHEPPTMPVTPIVFGISKALITFSNILVIIVVASFGGGIALAIGRRDRLSRFHGSIMLLGGVTWCTSLLAVLGHDLFKLPYPTDRTAIYFVPLLVLLAATELEWLPARATWTLPLRVGFSLYTVLMIARFCSEVTVSYYGLWWFDAGTKRIVERIAAMQDLEGSKLQISANWSLLPSLEFYRSTYALRKWAPIKGQYLKTDTSGDVVVIDSNSLDVIDQANLYPVFRDPVSGAVIAKHSTEVCGFRNAPHLTALANSASGVEKFSSGSLVSLYGTNFLRAGARPLRASPASLVFPTTLGCIAVEVSGIRAPIL